MSIQNIPNIYTAVTCHAWNADKSKIAFCPNNSEVHVYKKQGSEWVEEAVLREHDQVVTGIDWAPKTNRIVSCSQDRNAYVWTFGEGKWKPTLVILRINRGATQVKWSPDEKKFAVASGARCVSVCYFEEDNDWWVSKHIKKHKSSVLGLAWHPNNVFLATASSDFKARVFSAWVKGLDQKPTGHPFQGDLTFGDQLAEYQSPGWVHAIDWSPSGNRLAFVGHDSSISFVEVNNGSVERLALSGLPFRSLIFITENSVVAAGHENIPVLFTFQGSWAWAKNIDEDKAPSGGGASQSAKDMWQKKVDLGTTTNETTLSTKHQNAISCVAKLGASGGKVSQFSTSGVDGKVIIWDTNGLPLK
jgi:actin related protein 2/3 complex subunit 1A/1B